MAYKKIRRKSTTPLNLFAGGGWADMTKMQKTDSVVGAASGLMGILGNAVNQAKIADTSGIESNISQQKNNLVGATNNDALMSEWSAMSNLEAVKAKDLRSGNTGMGLLNGAVSGATSGAQFGPWGAAIGGAAGLISSGIGSLVGANKARKKAASLNFDIDIANDFRARAFETRAGAIDKVNDQNMTANYFDEGGAFGSPEIQFGNLHGYSVFTPAKFNLAKNGNIQGNYKLPFRTGFRAMPIVDGLSGALQLLAEEKEIQRSANPKMKRLQSEYDNSLLRHLFLGDKPPKGMRPNYFAGGGDINGTPAGVQRNFVLNWLDNPIRQNILRDNYVEYFNSDPELKKVYVATHGVTPEEDPNLTKREINNYKDRIANTKIEFNPAMISGGGTAYPGRNTIVFNGEEKGNTNIEASGVHEFAHIMGYPYPTKTSKKTKVGNNLIIEDWGIKGTSPQRAKIKSILNGFLLDENSEYAKSNPEGYKYDVDEDEIHSRIWAAREEAQKKFGWGPEHIYNKGDVRKLDEEYWKDFLPLFKKEIPKDTQYEITKDLFNKVADNKVGNRTRPNLIALGGELDNPTELVSPQYREMFPNIGQMLPANITQADSATFTPALKKLDKIKLDKTAKRRITNYGKALGMPGGLPEKVKDSKMFQSMLEKIQELPTSKLSEAMNFSPDKDRKFDSIVDMGQKLGIGLGEAGKFAWFGLFPPKGFKDVADYVNKHALGGYMEEEEDPKIPDSVGNQIFSVSNYTKRQQKRSWNKGFTPLNKHNPLFHRKAFLQEQAEAGNNVEVAKDIWKEALQLELGNRFIRTAKHIPFVGKKLKDLAYNVMIQNDGPSRTQTDIEDAKLVTKDGRSRGGKYKGNYNDPNRDLVGMYLDGKGRGFQLAPSNIVRPTPYADDIYKNNPNMKSYLMKLETNHNVPINSSYFAQEVLDEVMKTGIPYTELNGLYPVLGSSSDNVAHLAKQEVHRVPDGKGGFKLVLVSADPWDFSPGSYQKNWFQDSSSSIMDALWAQKVKNQAGLLAGIVSPKKGRNRHSGAFELIQNNPILSQNEYEEYLKEQSSHLSLKEPKAKPISPLMIKSLEDLRTSSGIEGAYTDYDLSSIKPESLWASRVLGEDPYSRIGTVRKKDPSTGFVKEEPFTIYGAMKAFPKETLDKLGISGIYDRLTKKDGFRDLLKEESEGTIESSSFESSKYDDPPGTFRAPDISGEYFLVKPEEEKEKWDMFEASLDKPVKEILDEEGSYSMYDRVYTPGGEWKFKIKGIPTAFDYSWEAESVIEILRKKYGEGWEPKLVDSYMETLESYLSKEDGFIPKKVYEKDLDSFYGTYEEYKEKKMKRVKEDVLSILKFRFPDSTPVELDTEEIEDLKRSYFTDKEIEKLKKGFGTTGGFEYAKGGKLNTGFSDYSNGLTFINNGGTHEENPYEGVPMGTDQNGTPNLVEEGEVKYKDFVFSNRIYATPEFLKEVGLKEKYQNHTYAAIAEKLSKESMERPNDPISKRGLEAAMAKLRNAQEAQKMQEQVIQENNLNMAKNKFDPGGFLGGDPWGIGMNQAVQMAVENAKKYGSTTSKGSPLSALRFAPVVGSALGVFSDAMGWTNKPNYKHAEALAKSNREVSFSPIGDYLSYDPLDRDFYQNKLNQQAGATRAAIANQAGGNRATATAGLLAADFGAQSKVGDLARMAEEFNLEQKTRVADFNRGTNQFNSEGSFRADEANRQASIDLGKTIAMLKEEERLRSMQGKNANINNLFDNLGNVGWESFNKDMINSNPALYYMMGNRGVVTKKARGGKLNKKILF